MPDRLEEIGDLLRSAGWQDAKRMPIGGDLSTRRYSYLEKDKRSAILMDADNSMEPFVKMTEWLLLHGFSAPEIYAGEPERGLLLLENFGDISVNRYMQQEPERNQVVHSDCVDLLLALRDSAAPDGLVCPDAQTLVDWTRLADDHYPEIQPQKLSGFRDVLHDALADALQTPPSISLRDFHADNMMWLGDRKGIRRLGLLDYQDAFLTHPVYDLVSFLTDARFPVAPARRKQTFQLYLDRSNDRNADFDCAFAAFSAQRNLRILAVFAQAAANGRRHHIDKIPLVHSYLVEALNHPVFDHVRDDTLAGLPDPKAVVGKLQS